MLRVLLISNEIKNLTRIRFLVNPDHCTIPSRLKVTDLEQVYVFKVFTDLLLSDDVMCCAKRIRVIEGPMKQWISQQVKSQRGRPMDSRFTGQNERVISVKFPLAGPIDAEKLIFLRRY